MTSFSPPRRALLALLVVATLLGGALRPARAWNGTGHMTVADLAYQRLTPDARKRVNALLAQHKAYATWISQMPAGYPDRDRYVFMKAATWPDDIRKTPDDRPIWHYIDVPVVAPGYQPDPVSLLPVVPNAETEITEQTKLLTAASATDPDKAVALSWVLHLVGDVHQPLHCSALFDADFPKGDKGGNSILLPADFPGHETFAASDYPPHNLHALWDDLIGFGDDPVAIDKTAATLETPAYARTAFPQLTAHRDVHAWILEGNALARQYVYLDGKLPQTVNPAAAGSGPNATPSVKTTATLPADYVPTARKIADQQIALAGYRLADTLNTAFAGAH